MWSWWWWLNPWLLDLKSWSKYKIYLSTWQVFEALWSWPAKRKSALLKIKNENENIFFERSAPLIFSTFFSINIIQIHSFKKMKIYTSFWNIREGLRQFSQAAERYSQRQQSEIIAAVRRGSEFYSILFFLFFLASRW